LYDDKLAGKAFPKAFCIARAMELMSPLFESERQTTNTPFYTQFCKKQLDFEVGGEFLPRAGRPANANIYFRSLVSLYYDDYKIYGDKITSTQTETGRSELRHASSLFAQLYGISQNRETFLQSSAQFTRSPQCKAELYGFVNDSFRAEFFTTFIQPMLDYQEQHAVRVNMLLMKMFQVTPDPPYRVLFSPLIHTGGKEQINAFGREAHDLLLDYYLHSEAYYIRAVIQLERATLDPQILQILT